MLAARGICGLGTVGEGRAGYGGKAATRVIAVDSQKYDHTGFQGHQRTPDQS